MLIQHEIQIRVRYQETDAMGRLHNANYFTYFEMGRTELLRAAGRSYKDFEAEGLLLVVAEIGCRYYRPAGYDDVLTLRTSTTEIGAASLKNTYELYRDQELLAKGHSTIACVDRNGRVQRLPDWMRGE